MKKWIFAFGLILIFVGIFMVSRYNLSNRTIVPVRTEVKSVTDQRSISWEEFRTGDAIFLEMRVGRDWPFGYFEDPGVLLVSVDFVDPRGNVTKFVMIYMAAEAGGSIYEWFLNVTENEGGLLVTTPFLEELVIGGVALFNGTYTATVTGIWPSREDPPSSLTLYKSEIEITTEYPYTALLPIGISVIVVGGVVSLLGVKGGKSKKVVKKRRVHVLPQKK